jgi:hypothetical protein
VGRHDLVKPKGIRNRDSGNGGLLTLDLHEILGNHT